ncbi:hypothetical protein JCM24511_03793 [Saitozyma sp. JCM 24511]|nr:hypothetical protein JCM24511_03793 [Saitozyma sp. JCM 24511]
MSTACLAEPRLPGESAAAPVGVEKVVVPTFAPSGSSIRLATYGTLAPGKPNEHKLAHLRGRWLTGLIRGRLVESGWGAALGFPGIILDETAAEVAVHVFESQDLPKHWPALDAFEGDGYARVDVPVLTAEGVLQASVYVIADRS